MTFSSKTNLFILPHALCFAFVFSVALRPRPSSFALTLWSLRSLRLCALRSHFKSLSAFECYAHIIDCFALSDFVLSTPVYYIVHCFGPFGFVLCTLILSRFATSGFALSACIPGHFTPSSFALRAHILLALLTHVSRFALTKI